MNSGLAIKTRSLRNKGAAMTEFAIVLPLLLILSLGLVELGRAVYQHTILGKSTDSASRYLSRVWMGMNQDCSTNTQWADGLVIARNLAVYGNESGDGSALLPGLSVDDVSVSIRQENVAGSAENVCVIRVESTVNFSGVFGDSVVPFLDLGAIQLSADRESRYLGE